MEDVINPAVPSTAGALLAEEWSINPLATLPSFLEMFMMDEASRSARKSLDAGMGILQQKLQAQAASSTTHGNEEDNSEGSSSSWAARRTSMLSYVSSLLRRSTSKAASTVAHLIQHYGPEISCLILYTLERHCLKSDACATISESLYGGRQAKLDRSSSQDKQQRKLVPLGDRDKTRLALLVALGPYIRARLLLWYQKLKQQQLSSSSSSPQQQQSAARLSLLQKLRKLFVWVYPMLHVSLSSMDMVYQWRFLLGHSVFFHPYAQLLGVVVRRVTQEDTLKSQSNPLAASASAASSSSAAVAVPLPPPANAPLTSPSCTDAPPGSSSTMRNAAVWALSSAVIFSWVSHFRSEYQRQRQELIIQQEQQQPATGNNNHHHQPTTTSNNLNSHLRSGNHISTTLTPPPPSSGMKKNALPAHLCPLCRQPRMHPTASSSGFVFCYKCLLRQVQDTGKCPVTGRDCRESQLLRLYEPNHSTAAVNSTATTPADDDVNPSPPSGANQL